MKKIAALVVLMSALVLVAAFDDSLFYFVNDGVTQWMVSRYPALVNGIMNGTINAATMTGADVCSQTNNAIAKFNSNGGAVVIPAKTGGYSACSSTIVIDRPVRLYCDGGVGTYDAASTNCAIRFAAGVRGVWIKPLALGKVSIENLNLTSASTALGSDDGILNQANSTFIKNVSIAHFGRDGLHVDSADLGGGVGNADGGVYENVMSDNNFRYGFRAEGSDGNTGTYINTKATSNGDYGYSTITPTNIYIMSTATNNGLVAGHGDYYDSGLGNRWIFPYSEGSRGFLVDTGETDGLADVSQFGIPLFTTVGSGTMAVRSGVQVSGNTQICSTSTTAGFDCTTPWQFLYDKIAVGSQLIIRHSAGNTLTLNDTQTVLAAPLQINAGANHVILNNTANGSDILWMIRATDTAPTGNFLRLTTQAQTNIYSVDVKGQTQQAGIVFASLGTPSNGTYVYCPDCTIAATCAGSGTGAFAKRLNGVWVCN